MANAGLMKADNNPLPDFYKGYADHYIREMDKGLAVAPPDITFKDAAKFIADMTPIVGDVIAVKEIYDELRKEDPNYYLVGALGGAALLGLIPGLGDVAAKLIKKGAQDLTSLAKRIEVDPNAVGMSGGNISLKPKVNSEVFLETLKKQKDKDKYLYVVHGGDDFEGGLDLRKVGTGEPGDYRPLGTGIYGLVFNPNNPTEALQSLGGAQRYGRHYGGGTYHKATENWKGYSDPIYKKIYERAPNGELLLPAKERLELLEQVYTKYPTRIVQEIIKPPKVHLFRIPKNKLNTINMNRSVLEADDSLSYIKELFDSGQVKRGPKIEYEDRYIPAHLKRLRGEAEQKEMPDLAIEKLGQGYTHNEIAIHNVDIVERVGKFDVADAPTYKKYPGAFNAIADPDDYEIMPTKKGPPKEIGPQEYKLNESIFDVTGKPKFGWRDSPKAKAKYEDLGIYRGPEGTFESGRPQTEAMKRAAMNPATLKRLDAEKKAAIMEAQRKEELTARPRKGPVLDLSTGIKNKLPGGRAKGGSIMAQDGMTPLVPNPNLPVPKPVSADDYQAVWDAEKPKRGKYDAFWGPTHPAIKYNYEDDKGELQENPYMTLLNKVMSGTLGIRKDVQKASDMSREFGENRLDNDVSEDTLRHMLLGGLTAKRNEGDIFWKEWVGPVARWGMDVAREGADPESKIDAINNRFGRWLREQYPEEEEFTKKAIEAAVDISEGREILGPDGKPAPEQPIRSIPYHLQKYIMSDEFNELSYDDKFIQLENAGVRWQDIQRIIEEGPQDVIPYERPTEEMKTGGMMAEPMTEAQQPPTGGGPKTPSNVARKGKQPKVKGKGLVQRQPDPRDVAMQEVMKAAQPIQNRMPPQQQQQMPMQAAKGLTAITVGIGAPDTDYMEAEKGEPPVGATKEEVADDQHVLMSKGELVVPANVVRYHGLGTYEGMRKEALMGLQDMEDAGQIEYIEDEETSKTNDGGLLTAQTGLTLDSATKAASERFIGEEFAGRPVNQVQPTPTHGSGYSGLVAPNKNAWKSPVSADFTKPFDATGNTTGGTTGGTTSTTTSDSGSDRGSYRPDTSSVYRPIETAQDTMKQFDRDYDIASSHIPTGATAFGPNLDDPTAINDFTRYVNARTPANASDGLMGKAGDMVDSAAGMILPFTGYQDKKIRESAADKLNSGYFGSKEEYDALIKTVNLPPMEKSSFGFQNEPDDPTLTQKINKAKAVPWDVKTEAAAAQFNQVRANALEQAKKDMNAPVLFKEPTRVDRFLEGSQRTDADKKATTDALEAIPHDSMSLNDPAKQKRIRELDAQRASDEYNRQLEIERDKQLEKSRNPFRAAAEMEASLPDPMAGQRSGAEQEQMRQQQQWQAQQAAEFDAFKDRETTRRAEDSAGKERGAFGGTPTATEGCVIATHGLSTGGFTTMEKAKAEIWCAKTYHGKWYGEAFRRGYRAAGQRCIDAGKAHEHYQEFKDFVAYGRGVKKGFGLGLKYYLRTVQFFITGLFISE